MGPAPYCRGELPGGRERSARADGDQHTIGFAEPVLLCGEWSLEQLHAARGVSVGWCAAAAGPLERAVAAVSQPLALARKHLESPHPGAACRWLDRASHHQLVERWLDDDKLLVDCVRRACADELLDLLGWLVDVGRLDARWVRSKRYAALLTTVDHGRAGVLSWLIETLELTTQDALASGVLIAALNKKGAPELEIATLVRRRFDLEVARCCSCVAGPARSLTCHLINQPAAREWTWATYHVPTGDAELVDEMTPMDARGTWLAIHAAQPHHLEAAMRRLAIDAPERALRLKLAGPVGAFQVVVALGGPIAALRQFLEACRADDLELATTLADLAEINAPQVREARVIEQVGAETSKWLRRRFGLGFTYMRAALLTPDRPTVRRRASPALRGRLPGAPNR